MLSHEAVLMDMVKEESLPLLNPLLWNVISNHTLLPSNRWLDVHCGSPFVDRLVDALTGGEEGAGEDGEGDGGGRGGGKGGGVRKARTVRWKPSTKEATKAVEDAKVTAAAARETLSDQRLVLEKAQVMHTKERLVEWMNDEPKFQTELHEMNELELSLLLLLNM